MSMKHVIEGYSQARKASTISDSGRDNDPMISKTLSDTFENVYQKGFSPKQKPLEGRVEIESVGEIEENLEFSTFFDEEKGISRTICSSVKKMSLPPYHDRDRREEMLDYE